jgi:hypothetical protein
MRRRKDKIGPGLEIDFDLLDSDTLRCYIVTGLAWSDGPHPRLVWMEYTDQEHWTAEESPKPRVMTRTLDNEQEWAEGRRFLRLLRYHSYACLADLATRRKEKGEFVIRFPPRFGNPGYVCDLDGATMTPGLGDPDSTTFADEDAGFMTTYDIAEAQRFTHADANRLTIRVMEVMGYDLPGDNGNYYEPVRVDIAEELHARAKRRPRTSNDLHAMLNDISREP